MWDVKAGRLLKTINVPQRSPKITLNSLALSRDGKLSASGNCCTYDGTVTITIGDVGTGRSVRSIAGADSTPNGLAFSPNGRQLASTGTDKDHSRKLKVWDVASGRLLSSSGGWIL